MSGSQNSPSALQITCLSQIKMISFYDVPESLGHAMRCPPYGFRVSPYYN